MDTALHALNRFGLGASIGERRRLRDARGWLEGQLDGAPPLLDAGPTADELSAAVRDARAAQGSRDAASVREARRRVAALANADVTAVIERRLTTERPFLERLVAFWSNHLCVSKSKGTSAPLTGLYEREAIRPHVLGRFEDMVLASARHPAMLLYLDNAQSIGPSSRAAQRARRRERGLNENYARELLELHTLGVDGGYTQQDVQELSRILTGWTLNGALSPRRGEAVGIAYAFEQALHEPGSKTLLGVRYSAAGEAEGVRAIEALCRHPSTARFIATKLVRHFVADDPPASAVTEVERAFVRSEGDLRVTTRALLDQPEAWDAGNQKFRTPQDWLIAVLRALNVDTVRPPIPVALQQLRHPLWGPPAPNGYSDAMRDWADPDSLLNRAELARSIARRVPGRFDPRLLLDVIDVNTSDPLYAMAGDTSISVQDRVALVIAAPAFQWR